MADLRKKEGFTWGGRAAWLAGDSAEDLGGIARDSGIGGNILGDDTAGAHDGIFADGDTTEDGGARADRSPAPDDGLLAGPVGISLQLAVGGRGPGVGIVDEGDAVTHKDF